MSPEQLKETVGNVAMTLADSLKSQPLIVGLLVINLLFLLIITFAVREERQQAHAERRILLERCLPIPGRG